MEKFGFYGEPLIKHKGRAGLGSISPSGYRMMSVGEGRKSGEHRLVMERLIGRKLLDDETVHHRNGDRSDNREENLELWCSNHPAGQRVIDLVAWAKEILARYA